MTSVARQTFDKIVFLYTKDNRPAKRNSFAARDIIFLHAVYLFFQVEDLNVSQF